VASDSRGTSDGRERAPALSSEPLDDRTLSATFDGEDDPFTRRGDEIPERIDRYLVLAKLGSGAMGAVYSAYDPDLDRKLALKFLHESEQSDGRTIRLLREAQALARVSHPNVIQVYDVGTFEGRVYIAMEYIDGVSLGVWLAAERRSPAAIVATFAQAGHGLAAAHEKGRLVHRDFKPDNVLVARDGRVVVLDFGIAHAIANTEPREQDDAVVRERLVAHAVVREARAEASNGPGEHTATRGIPTALLNSTALATEVTRAGALIGTPAYMAPEQLEGRATDERSDQFSFCVVLWEALHGERPFAGSSPLALWKSMRDDAIRPPASPRIPGAIQRALNRGLSLDPDRRFPSMAALLAVLDRDPATTKKRLTLAALAFAAVGLVVGRAATRPASEPICDGAEQRFEASWGPARRAALEQAFTRSPLALAGQSLPAVLDGLDHYAAQWRAMYGDACEATHVRGEQSEELLDLRMACLADRKLGFDALVEVLLEPDATVVENAYAAVAALRPIDTCANHRALTARVAPPDDLDLAERVAEIEIELSLARARRDAGAHERAMAIARAAEAQAVMTAYAPIQAAALIEVGLTANESGEYEAAAASLREGFYQALAAGDEQSCVEAATALVHVSGDNLRDFDAAENWARVADALLDRRSDQRSRARVELEFFIGIMHWRKGELERAQAELEAALALAGALTEDPRMLEIRVRKGLGSTLWSRGKPDEAAAQFEIVVDALTRELGPDHPKLGSALNNLASAHYSLGRHDLAEAEFVRVLEIYQASHGDEHPSVANSLNNLAVVYTRRGKLEQARDTHLRVIGIYERTLGLDHPELANSWSNLGRVLRRLHDFAGAADYYAQAYERRSAALGPEHSDTMTSLAGLALTSLDLARLAGDGADHDALRAEGLARLDVVLDTQRRLLGDDHPSVAEAEQDFGTAPLELDPKRGRELLRKALATRERTLPPDHPDLADSLAALAHALVSDQPNEAIELLERVVAIEDAAPQASRAPGSRARVRLDLARASLARGDRTRARASARAGLELLESVEGPEAKRLRRELRDALAPASD